MQEYTVYGYLIKHVAITVTADSEQEALEQARWKYQYDNAEEVKKDKTFEKLDRFIKFEAAYSDDD